MKEATGGPITQPKVNAPSVGNDAKLTTYMELEAVTFTTAVAAVSLTTSVSPQIRLRTDEFSSDQHDQNSLNYAVTLLPIRKTTTTVLR